MVHLLVSQMNIDIFLVDWERPHAVNTTGPDVTTSTKEMAVSVWRTYLVANEWNELQTRRKIHLGLQVILVVFILKVVLDPLTHTHFVLDSVSLQICGVENIATADPKSVVDLHDGYYHSDFSYVCRFALASSIYILVTLIQVRHDKALRPVFEPLFTLQIIFWCGIYNGCVEDKLQQFMDVCSMANISVFVMACDCFGYYIHGKSAHGFADTDMATLLEQLQREADDFCGHRGLQAGSDDQSFIMILPKKLRSYYDNIVAPAAADMAGSKFGAKTQGLSNTTVQHMVDAYSKMNKFLTRFLEHVSQLIG